MDSKDIEKENQQSTKQEQVSTTTSSSSCRKKHVNDDNATFYANLKDHMNEFFNASMDQHKTCFKNTFNNMFGMSKEVEIQAPLHATSDSTT
ncbi:unnamed protein product [Cochlearia groenlandica]